MGVDPSTAWLYNNNRKNSKNPNYAAINYPSTTTRPTDVPAGYNPHQGTKIHPAMSTTTTQYPTYVSLIDLRNSWDTADIKYAQALLAARGLISGDYQEGFWDEKTRDAVQDAIINARFNGITLTEYLTASRADTKGIIADAGGGSASGADGAGGPSTFTQTTVNLSNRTTARTYLTAALSSKLGRDPTKAEIDTFLRALNVKERKNPVVTTTTTTPNKDGSNVESSTVTKGGVEGSSFAQGYAKKHGGKEAKEYGSGHYMQLVNSMVGLA